MKNVFFAVILVLLYGCGNAPFTSGFSAVGVEPDGGPPPGTGGRVATSTGGAPGTGGHVGVRGGSSSTGGAPEVDAGGSTGGAPETGGAVATGGAETGGSPPSTGGVAVVDAGCELVTHDNGAGQTWQDCVPLGTYNEEQALTACRKWSVANSGSGCIAIAGTQCGAALKVTVTQPSVMQWWWQGPNAGNVIHPTSTAGCNVVGTWD